jgi:hypothetical protein
LHAAAIAVRDVAVGVRSMPVLERVIFACFGSAALVAYEHALHGLG